MKAEQKDFNKRDRTDLCQLVLQYIVAFMPWEKKKNLFNFTVLCFHSNKNPSSSHLVDTMMSFPGIDNACLDKPDDLYVITSPGSFS